MVRYDRWSAASAWGGNPDKDAVYLNVFPAKKGGSTVYKLKASDVPVDGFWSVSVYDGEGSCPPKPLNAYTLNNITAARTVMALYPYSLGDTIARYLLPSNYERMELYGAPLSSPHRNSEREMEFS